MATAGRKPKPTAIKLLEGNPGKRKLNKREPKPRILKTVPECPEWLLPEAQKEWGRLAPALVSLGLITNIDIDDFAAYCQAFARWHEAETYITENGTTYMTETGQLKPIPQVAQAQQYIRLMKDLSTEFGMTPSSRSRLISDATHTNESDDMDALLGGEGY